MEIKINPIKLLNMLRIISGATCLTKKNDIFAYILIKRIKNKLFCISINDEIEIVTTGTIEDNTDITTDFIIKYDLIYNICRFSKNDTYIKIKKTQNCIEINTNISSFNIPTLHNSEYPSFKNEKKSLIKIQTTSSDLKNLFYYPYIILSEHNKNIFSDGLLIDINKNCINSFSSDGVKTAFSQMLIKESNNKIKLIIPKSIIKEFINTYKENEIIFLNISENYIKIINNKTTITTRLINNLYDNIYQSISLKMMTKTITNTNEFKKAITLLNPICYNNILVLTIKTDKIILTVKHKSEHGTTIIKAKSDDPEITISLDYNNLTNILKIIQSEYTEIIITENKKNIIIKEPTLNCIYIVTPLNI